MKLNDIENFHTGFNSYNVKNYTTLENCKELVILGATEDVPEGIIISLDKGGNCFVKANDEVAKQYLMKILPVIQKDYIGKNLEDLLNFEFNFAERIN